MRAYLLGGRPIHFPFLSGILRYDCEPCEAPCCHGPALGIGRSKELVTLISVQPKITLFAQPGFAGSSMLSLASPAEACWFLGKKGGCRLHQVAGRGAKPAGCRLFPFQTLRSVGEAIAVLPDFLCPLVVADAPSDGGESSHDELALELHRTGVPRGGHAPLPDPPDVPWREAIPLERRIVEAASAHLFDDDYLPYAEAQRALTAKLLSISKGRISLERLRQSICRLLDVGEVPSRAAVHDLVALTGTLRLFGAAMPRRELPGVLVALSVLLGAYEGMRGARRSARTVVTLFQERLPLLYVLAHLTDRPMLRDAERAKRMLARLPAVRAPLLEVFEALVDNREQSVAETLEDILMAQGGVFAPPLSAESVAMLTGLGKVLMKTGVFVPA